MTIAPKFAPLMLKSVQALFEQQETQFRALVLPQPRRGGPLLAIKPLVFSESDNLSVEAVERINLHRMVGGLKDLPVLQSSQNKYVEPFPLSIPEANPVFTMRADIEPLTHLPDIDIVDFLAALQQKSSLESEIEAWFCSEGGWTEWHQAHQLKYSASTFAPLLPTAPQELLKLFT